MVQRTQSARHSMLLYFHLKSCTWDREPHAQVYARYRQDRKQLCRKGAKVLLDKSNTGQQHALVLNKGSHTLRCISNTIPCRSGHCPLFGTWDTTPGILCLVLDSLVQQTEWCTRTSPVGSYWDDYCWSTTWHMRMHWRTSLVSIKSRWWGRRKSDSCLYLLRGYKEKGARL